MDDLTRAGGNGGGDDPLHTLSRPTTLWTTVNAAEALPGTVTPLTWSWYRIVAEFSTRGAFHDLGVLASREVCFPPDPDDRIIGVFFGRNAINVTVMRSFVERIPGQSGDDFERQLFDTPVSGSPSRSSRRRYPAILGRAPRAAALARRRLRALEQETDRWWRASVNDDGLLPGRDAAAVFAESKALAIRIYVVHIVGSMLATGAMGKLSALARQCGVPGIESKIITGLGSLGETTMLDDLWTVSRGRSDLAEFRRRFGYHGPMEGELSARSWREDGRPLLGLLETYRRMPEEAAPRAVLARQQAEARVAEDEFLAAAIGGRRRLEARALLGLVRHYVPMRELGRATLLRAVDGARAAARAAGAGLWREQRLTEPEDAFFLTSDELFGVPADGPAIVAERRKRSTTYAGFNLPEWWKGVPDPTTEASITSEQVAGIPVSPGIIEGRARVLLSPEDGEELQAGEIVVCPFTDPGWAALFLVAGALVIDVGGPMSHGAIVARELGVPCVINTRTGTRVFSTGDLVRVDGTTGSVVRLERAAPSPTGPVPTFRE